MNRHNENRIKLVLCGGVLADIILAGLPSIAEPGKVVYAPKGVHLRVGGHPTNIARDLVKLGIPSEDVHLAISIGNDFFGQYIEATLDKFDINLELQKNDNVDTSKNVILIVEGEDRRFHIAVGASEYLDSNRVIQLTEKIQPSIFYAGALRGKILEEIDVVLKKAKELGCITFLDTRLPLDRVKLVLQYTDLLHLNNVEAMHVTGTDDVTTAIEKLLHLGVKIPFITSGEGGAVVKTRDFELWQPVFEKEVIDPTGAGDAFCAGIIYSLMEKLRVQQNVKLTTLSPTDLREIVLFGQAVGAVCCTGVGTTEAVNRKAVNTIIERQGERIRKKTRISIN